MRVCAATTLHHRFRLQPSLCSQGLASVSQDDTSGHRPLIFGGAASRHRSRYLHLHLAALTGYLRIKSYSHNAYRGSESRGQAVLLLSADYTAAQFHLSRTAILGRQPVWPHRQPLAHTIPQSLESLTENQRRELTTDVRLSRIAYDALIGRSLTQNNACLTVWAQSRLHRSSQQQTCRCQHVSRPADVTRLAESEKWR